MTDVVRCQTWAHRQSVPAPIPYHAEAGHTEEAARAIVAGVVEARQVTEEEVAVADRATAGEVVAVVGLVTAAGAVDPVIVEAALVTEVGGAHLAAVEDHQGTKHPATQASSYDKLISPPYEKHIVYNLTLASST